MRPDTSHDAAQTDRNQAFDPARDVREDLRRYLTTTDIPAEIYQLVRQDRDRQLRRLTRRFVNQIQHGCQNVLCDAPTCLSYRRRVTSGPLRPHNDVAARALAAKCVEHYASSSRDLDGCRKLTQGVISSADTSTNSIDGLCQNLPIVPWYADAKEYFEKTNTVANRTLIADSRQPNYISALIERSPRSRISSGAVKRPGNRITSPARHTTRSPSPAAIERSLRNEVKQQIARPGPVLTCNSIRSVVWEALGAPESVTQSAHWKEKSRTIIQDEFEKTKLERALREAVRSLIGDLSDDAGLVSKAQRYATAKLDLPLDFFRHDRWKYWSIEIVRNEYAQGKSVDVKSSAVDGCDDPPNSQAEPTSHSTTRQNEAQNHLRDIEHQSHRIYEPFDPASMPQYLFKRNPILAGLAQIDVQAPSPVHAVHTFKVLPLSAIKWLRRICAGNSLGDFDQSRAFAEQSVYYVFANPHRLLATITHWCTNELESCEDSDEYVPWQLPYFQAIKSACISLVATAAKPQTFNQRVFCHLRHMLEHAYILPPWLEQASGCKHASYLSNAQIAYLLLLTSTMAYVLIGNESRTSGISYDADQGSSISRPDFMYETAAGDQPLLHLLTTIADLVTFRIATDAAWADRIRKTGKGEVTKHKGILEELKDLLQRSKPLPHSICFPHHLVENMRFVIRTRWDRKPIIQRNTLVAGAFMLLQMLYDVLILSERNYNSTSLRPFVVKDIASALDKIEAPYEWLNFESDTTQMHVLQFPFLLGIQTAFNCFRSINLKIMKDSYDYATMMSINSRRQLVSNPSSPWKVNNAREVFDKIRPYMAKYFVLTVSRETLLEDAIGQIWRREHQELKRPLKVQLGMEEGEQGLDHGGVQQEFFRLVFREAFSAKYGLFDTDPQTHFSWFKPGAVEPMYKYEALGVLMSLAVYNGVTVPVNMPLAFYRRILKVKSMLIWQQIEDAWPDLARSLHQMVEWEDGDVGDTICRTYEFSYEAFGEVVCVDMSKHRNPWNNEHSGLSNSDEVPLVTNANRADFVKHYIYYLTEKSVEAQLNAFVKGIYTLLSPKALSLFSPHQLKILVEGRPDTEPLHVEKWREITTYEDYTKDDQVIVWFWEILEQDLSQEQLRKLLEFVTATDRLPISGWDGVRFLIQRNAEDKHLPSSSTCYGRLFLPEYESKQVLKQKLELAIENSLGFGQV